MHHKKTGNSPYSGLLPVLFYYAVVNQVNEFFPVWMR